MTGGKMYTLEDDKETTSSLRKRELLASSQTQGAAGPSKGETGDAQRLSLSAQVTNTFKKITTPTKAPTGGKGAALAALTMACIGVFFTAMDQTVVVTALPPIVNDLNIGVTKLDHAAWIISAYLLGFVIAMPLMGRVSDIYGRRRIFILCLGIFGAGSILCGLAPVFGQMSDLGFLNAINVDTSSPGLIWLIAARFIQAVGGGAVVPVAMAIASDFYGQERRGLALGIIGAVTEAGGVIGPLYGAIIVQQFGWQYIFFFNVPIFVDTVLQRPVLDSGLALLRLTAMIPLGALLGGWLCSRITCRFTAVLGLLFTATGFYLMSRWPIYVDWTHITISTVTAGFGFGLVIAPIGTTAINAVRSTQAGMSSAIVTSLRMAGMMLGLAALTSWALAYFKQLVSTYPSLPLSATSAQFADWSKGYGTHIIASAHTVYSAVFFTSMVLCLIAIVPALFLWGRKTALVEQEVPGVDVEAAPVPVPEEPASPEDETVPVTSPPLTGISVAAADILRDPSLPTELAQPPLPPTNDNEGNDGNGGRNPKKRRRLIIAAASIL